MEGIHIKTKGGFEVIICTGSPQTRAYTMLQTANGIRIRTARRLKNSPVE